MVAEAILSNDRISANIPTGRKSLRKKSAETTVGATSVITRNAHVNFILCREREYVRSFMKDLNAMQLLLLSTPRREKLIMA